MTRTSLPRLLMVSSFAVLALSGCFYRYPVGVTVHPGHPAPPPPARRMSYDDAVREGWGYCRGHNYPCDLQNAHQAGNVWRVHFKVRGGGLKGQLKLAYDVYSGALVNVDDDVRRGHGNGRGWDD